MSQTKIRQKQDERMQSLLGTGQGPNSKHYYRKPFTLINDPISGEPVDSSRAVVLVIGLAQEKNSWETVAQGSWHFPIRLAIMDGYELPYAEQFSLDLKLDGVGALSVEARVPSTVSVAGDLRVKPYRVETGLNLFECSGQEIVDKVIELMPELARGQIRRYEETVEQRIKALRSRVDYERSIVGLVASLRNPSE